MNHTTAWQCPDTYLNVYEKDQLVRIAVHEESAIDAAVSAFLETGKDSLLHIEFVEDGEYCVRASQITSWYCTSPKFRDRVRELEKLLEDEKKANGWQE